MFNSNRFIRVLLIAIAASLLGCAPKETPLPLRIAPKTIKPPIVQPPPNALIAPPIERAERTITLIAVGDNLIHAQLIKAAKTKNGYDFAPFYEQVAPIVKSADIAFINQETLISGKAFGYSGYPAFNGPSEVGEAIYNIGFNAINHATNHAMDKGKKALLATIAFWKKKPKAIMIGAYESREERKTPKILEIDGAKFGFLAYTYGLNGIKLPKDSPYLVSLIDTAVMAREIDNLRPKCDYLIVSMHWGDEYKHTPNKTQERLARFLADRGVDLVIGHHPHVLQGARWIDRKDGNQTLVYFSLGNFISAQNKTPRTLGGMARVVLSKKGATLAVKEAKLSGLVTHYEKGLTSFKVYPLESYTKELASRHALSAKKGEKMGLDYLLKLYGSIVAREFRSGAKP